ncbi:MAG: type I-U CRISPR-associated helicase/endonuclease Cas3 [Caldilineaceae bacterium]|nr:type I-U CRISPR-associated helicase/endonuclease Cas3 [Caldilineaceae bacterium]
MNRDLTAADFPAFFEEIHGYPPFPWQHRLTRLVLERKTWPPVIALPTGTGKTAVLDTAVFCLAVDPVSFPRRTVFVIDRRIVVDQVCERARCIRDRVAGADSGVLGAVKARLAGLSDGEPLEVAALRGGIPLDNQWARQPDRPWVVVSTVDQFGSRLLFRGYGVRPRMQPIHAGLAGNDCLVILDEVHLSAPFAETLQEVDRQTRSDLSGQLPRRFQVVQMSATVDESMERFTLEAEDTSCEELRRRVEARKEATLVDVPNVRGVPKSVLRIMNSINKSHAASNGHTVGIVVNRVGTARDVHRTLCEAGFEAHLITGRMRPLDRLAVLDTTGPLLKPDREVGRNGITPVVATQAIEVGADFSFDSLITECAPIDSLRQRFGRLDRRGIFQERTGTPAQAWILGVKTSMNSKKPDPVYGDAVKATWTRLLGRVEGEIIELTDIVWRESTSEETRAPRDQAPLLLKSHLDVWCQTNPQPPIQPELTSFLHGMEEDSPADVSLVWRWDRTIDAMRLVPPRQAEYLQVPIGAVRAWLSGTVATDFADVDRGDETGFDGDGDKETGCLRWEGSDKEPVPIRVRDIRPGDILLVDPERGGIRSGTWDPEADEPVADLGDYAQLEHGRKVTLRLDQRLLYFEDPPLPDLDEVDIEPIEERIRDWLEQMQYSESETEGWQAQAAKKLLCQGFRRDPVNSGKYYILSQIHKGPRPASSGRPVVDSDAWDGSDYMHSLIGTGIPLRDHLAGVARRASLFAERLGLPQELQDDICLAGKLHDIGKADPRFQWQMVGGDPVALAMLEEEEPLAKSLPEAKRVRINGPRHEITSVAMLGSAPGLLADAHDRDLVLHLISTHHGWGRPFLPVVPDEDPQEPTYKFEGQTLRSTTDLAGSSLALDMTDRFWKLIERYGYHGLAWLEAILRLADHKQSEIEAEEQ